MRYTFLIYIDERAAAARTPAEAEAGIAAHTPYIDALRANRKYIAGDALHPAASARTLRAASGKPIVTHGPFAESREQFGGYYVIDAADLDDGIAIAARNPAFATVGLGIEIRPVVEPPVAPPPGHGPRFALIAYGDVDRAALRASGRCEALEGLASPGSATTVRVRGTATALTDGPFDDRPIGTFAIVRARDLDDAVALASSVAGRSSIEIRAVRS